MKTDGECIIDLVEPYSVLGKVVTHDEEQIIEIEDDARIYNPTDIIPVRTVESNELIKK